MFGKKAAALAAVSFAAASLTAIGASAADYGQAGVMWMIKDEWEHRNGVGLEPFNEKEDNNVTCSFKDVNITGNGDYTVEFSGWCVPDDTREYVEVGTLGLDTNIDFDANPDCVITLTGCTIDGVDYTFNEQPVLEDSNDGNHILKIKNAYGVNASTTPEMDATPWNTTDPITISFTVSGLAEDKIADNPDEIIESSYEEKAPEAESDTDSDDVESTVESTDDTSSGSVNATAVAAAIAVPIVVIIVAAVIIVKKKK